MTVESDETEDEANEEPEVEFTDADRKAAYIQSTGAMRELLTARKEQSVRKPVRKPKV